MAAEGRRRRRGSESRGPGFRIQDSGFRVQDLGFRVQRFGSRIRGFEFRDHGAEIGFVMQAILLVHILQATCQVGSHGCL